MQVMESAYGNMLRNGPASSKRKCSPRRLVFILMCLTITMFLLFIIMAAFLFVMYSHTFEERNTIVQSISQMIQNVSEQSYCGSCWKKFDGSCYLFEVNRMTLIEARLFCKRMDSDLVIINSVKEQEFLHSKTGENYYWIGLQMITDVWTWVDGTILKASSGFWLTGEPNNQGGKESCAHLTFKGKINDAPCDDVEYKCHAICEKKDLS